MDDYKHLCPVCKTKGKTTFLQLRQINFTTATYLCKDTKCTYPQGHSWIYVDRDIFNEDDSDSDSSNVSDEVNADIERMLLTMQNNTEYLNNNYTSEKDKIDLNVAKTDSIVIDDPGGKNSSQQTAAEDSSEDVIFVDSVTEVDNVIIDDPDELFCTLDLPRSSSTTNRRLKVIASGAPDSEIVDVTISKDATPVDIQYNLLKNDSEPYKFKLDIEMIHQNKDDAKLNITKTATSDANIPEPGKESNTFKLDIEKNNHKNDIVQSILVDNIEMIDQKKVKLNIRETDTNNKEPNKQDFKLADQKEVNSKISPSKVKEIKVNPKKSICILNVNTGNVSTLTQIERKDVNLNKAKKIDNLKVIQVPFNVNKVINVSQKTYSRQNIKIIKDLPGSQNKNEKISLVKPTNCIDLEKLPISKVINVSKSIKSERNVISQIRDLSDSEEKNDKIFTSKLTNIENINSGQDVISRNQDLSDSEEQNENNTSINHTIKDLQNILKDDNLKDNTIETNRETRNSDENSTTIAGRLRSRKNSVDLILPISEDDNNFPKSKYETVFRSKLRVHSKKPKESSFYLSESIIEEALKTTKNNKNAEPQKNRSLVSLIFDSNNVDKVDKKSAAAFTGFKFSSKTIKQSNSGVSKKKNIKESPSQKEKKSNKKVRDSEEIVTKPQADIINNDSNTNVSSKSEENKNNVSLGIGDLTLNELLDDMTDLGTVNGTNNSMDIAEVDDWLTSLIQ